ncbi:MAG: SDR family oxidoreductase [Pseudomonadota bacterium]
MSEVTIIGCGDIGSRVAKACLARGDRVQGWVRTPASLERLRDLEIPDMQVDLDAPAAVIPGIHNHQLFYFAPPPAAGQEDHRVARLIQLCRESVSPSRVIYLSTSGVYGDCQGEWVDETRPPNPVVDRARRRLDAESRWKAWSRETGGELVILRVAGIYGPNKLPLQRLQSGQPMVSEEDSPITNHIHIFDLVKICLTAMQRGRTGEVYNVSDGHPGSMTGYFNQVADFLKLPRPPLITKAQAERLLSPGMLSYLRESRCLSNKKMLDELGVVLSYPSLIEGLPACLTPKSWSEM